ncbi:NucA/NucB deoxyribonuclease domain-containing protein [Rhodococcus sp. NBC_00294]|uniref:NucA/NucB deoxyribonuclease domain-containing protein n=1 Tax=Rhodococcus sp. NBC_00294 TaxID=2976004 RepID=UPI003FA78EDC
MRYVLNSWKTVNGVMELAGSEKGFVYHDGKADASAKSQVIDYRVRIVRAVSTGDTIGNTAVFKTSVGGSQSRTGEITPAANIPRVVSLSSGGQTLTWKVTAKLPKPGEASYSQRWEWDTVQGSLKWASPRYTETPVSVLLESDLVLPTARCDNFQYIFANDPGCVMAPTFMRRNLPVMDLTTTRNLPTPSEATQFWDHVLTAQNSGVPGQPVALAALTGAGVALQRIPNADQAGEAGRQARQNRRTACSKRVAYRPAPGVGGYNAWECDEYPFASTHQGARLDPSNGRTRDWCFIQNLPINIQSPGGWSACYIPKDMNQAGGQLIAPFNRENRILLRADDPLDGYFVSAYH